MRILLIEDDDVVSAFLQRGLSEAGHTMLLAQDGLDGLDYALNERFDVAIVDLMLPKLDGLAVIERMRCQGIQSPVLILSARRSVDDRITGLRAGGDDYLIKPFSYSELLARLEALSRRAAHTDSSSTLCFDDIEMDLLSRSVSRAGQRIDLQPKEFALLEYLIRNAGIVVSRTMIMERVWNYTFDPCTNVVEARISKLREKIDKQYQHTLIHTIRGAGYVLKREAD
ncbi:winged helix-turn-helix domain-containing protein [Granulosicoccus sp. 3-233]|uniref:winged helix-turn-helix domain-containing protein n=1 Tax=Granulosicoccus sp. 3-233 TaxID=3417969 RepID=UPI003D326A68